MNVGRLLMVTLMIASCTKTNPAKYCETGTCTDPAYPFCDVTGAVGGEAGTCIAVTCTAGAFTECRGDVEVRCNATGNNMEVVQCERGCDAAADGCRLCNPGETACTNGKVATCDGAGSVTSTTDCPLGCFESEPRCRQIQPSNGLASFADMVANPPDLDLNDATLDTSTGLLADNGVDVPVPNFLAPATQNGPAIRVLVVDKLNIQRLAVDGGGQALAIVATGDVSVTGLVQIAPGSGRFEAPGCSGGNGVYAYDCVDVVSGAGGGANATNGGKGGDVTAPGRVGGAGGIAAGTAQLTPLRGGCSGGGVNGPAGGEGSYGMGGGALQITSGTKISVGGIISAKGQDGGADYYYQRNGFWESGGGAGGSVLLEAPIVMLDGSAQLLASGGTGAGLCDTGSTYCGVGGTGAHAGTASLSGGTATCDGVHFASGGAGGGGLGRIRINTRDGMYTKANTAVEDGSVSTGMHATR
jgi:hypothetical protein